MRAFLWSWQGGVAILAAWVLVPLLLWGLEFKLAAIIVAWLGLAVVVWRFFD